MNFHVVTLFTDVCRAYTDASILGRAQKSKKIKISYFDPRDFANNKHKKVDDKPYGGGPGMVMYAEPIVKAVQKAVGRKKDKKKVKVLFMSPRGKKFDQTYAKRLAQNHKDIVLVSGRYEGIDARAMKILKKEYSAEEISTGDYVLTGGELPALTTIDATARHVAGVLGNNESLEDERAASGELYTRPEVFVYKKKKYTVPKVLTGGNHREINIWRESKDS